MTARQLRPHHKSTTLSLLLFHTLPLLYPHSATVPDPRIRPILHPSRGIRPPSLLTRSQPTTAAISPTQHSPAHTRQQRGILPFNSRGRLLAPPPPESLLECALDRQRSSPLSNPWLDALSRRPGRRIQPALLHNTSHVPLPLAVTASRWWLEQPGPDHAI